jgi:Ssp1 endopeptidase immunity protein Rap1a
MCALPKRRCAARLLLAAALLVGASASPADEDAAMSADDLQQLCAGTDHVSENACRIYILGVTQGVRVGISLAQHGAARPCVPAGMSAEELQKFVKTRLTARLAAVPADRSLDASRFIAAVLASAYPCRRPPAAGSAGG